MQLTYRYKLYPSRAQEEKLMATLDRCRWLYNHFLDQLNQKEDGKIPRRYKLQAMLPKLKREHPELRQIHSKVLQMVLHQLYSNLCALAKLKRNGYKVGWLRFKGRGWFKSFTYNQSGFRLDRKKLVLSKIGEISIKLHREIKGKVKGVAVKRERSGKWFAAFQVEDIPEPLPKADKVIGMDMGIKHFLSDTDGRQIENPKFYEKSLERIKVGHRQLSKKKKDSKKREKARIKLARAYEKLVNQRNDFLHKLSKFYVNRYDIVVAEDLTIKNMVRNHRLSGKIFDASWGKFLYMLAYKAERAGRRLVKVDPKGTSKEYKHGELDKDYNSALNILERGLVGLEQSELTPVEMEPLLGLTRVPASSVIEAGSPAL